MLDPSWVWRDPSAYNFISGPLADVTLLVGLFGWWVHVNCIEKGCWRKGHKDPEHGHPLCRRHQEKVG